MDTGMKNIYMVYKADNGALVKHHVCTVLEQYAYIIIQTLRATEYHRGNDAYHFTME